MANKHSKFEALANKLIEKSGTIAQLIGDPTQTGPSYEPVNVDPDPVDCLVFLTMWSNREIDGTLIKAGDRQVLMALQGLMIKPKVGNKLVIGGDTFRIVDPLNEIAPAGDAVVYKMNVRN